MTRDSESPDPDNDGSLNPATAEATARPSTGEPTAGPSEAGQPILDQSGAEPPVAAPRRRATRSRTTKKAVAPAPEPSGEVESGQLPFLTGTELSPPAAIGTDPIGTDPVPGTGQEPEAGVVPVKRTRAPRKRTAPRSAVAPAAEVVGPANPVSATEATGNAAGGAVQAAGGAGPETSGDAVSGPAAPPEAASGPDPLTGDAGADSAEPVNSAEPVKKAARRRTRKATSPAFSTDTGGPGVSQTPPETAPAVAAVAPFAAVQTPAGDLADGPADGLAGGRAGGLGETENVVPPRVPIMPLFQAPEPAAPRARRAASRPAGPPKAPVAAPEPELELEPASEPVVDAGADAEPIAAVSDDALNVDFDGDLDPARAEGDAEDVNGEELDLETDELEEEEDPEESSEQEGSSPRRRRRRGGRGRRGRGRTDADSGDEDGTDEAGPQDSVAGDDESPAPEIENEAEAVPGSEDDEPEESAGESSGSRRRRRRRRRGSSGGETEAGVEDSPNVVTKVRDVRRDDVTAVRGSTRLEAKKQRRREGREAGRRRTILTEAEFLTRRESVDRVMVVREREGRTQIGVLEDGLLVEHYVARKTQTSTVGNVYLGRVQNVLPSMEAAFVDIGKGRNAVLYAGEVNWDAAGLDGQPRRIEHALKAGEAVLVQVTKDPIGHKGARLTSQISMPGRYLVYVPDGSMTGISRKLPDTERSRLKKILREIVPDDAGVIVRTAAEGASDEELERDVARLRAQWEDIASKIQTVQAPAMLYGEPDLAIKVVRDIFNEDFGKLIISGDDAWDTLQGYISHVAPDLAPRLERWTSTADVFAAHRIDEQLAKALDRKVYLPSGGSLVIDRTEAMTVVDVNTGKFTGSGGNLEETVTKNNLEAAEEVVHQLRLRDIGGIIVVDFIDMVLESNRDLVLRRLLECLGRDRTRHQVAEVTSLGLVQMTRKRVGQGLLEVFSETCEVCGGRGLVMHDEPVEKKQPEIMMGGGGGAPRKGRSHAH